MKRAKIKWTSSLETTPLYIVILSLTLYIVTPLQCNKICPSGNLLSFYALSTNCSRKSLIQNSSRTNTFNISEIVLILKMFLPGAARIDPCCYGNGHGEQGTFPLALSRSPRKYDSIWTSGSHFVQQSVTICVILIEGIMRNDSVKLF